MLIRSLDSVSVALGLSAGISYVITSGDPFGYFTVGSTSGQIKTTSVQADRERYAFIILNMRAEKNGIISNAQV